MLGVVLRRRLNGAQLVFRFGVRRGLLSTSDTTVDLSRNMSHLLLPATTIRIAHGSGLLGSRWFLNG